jgi:Ethanolamine utilization protein
MKNLMLVKKSEVKPKLLEDVGEGNKISIQDVFAKAEECPFTFGMVDLEPSIGVEFDYDNDGATCYCLDGKITLTDKATSESFFFEPGDFVYIPQETGKVIVWSSDIFSKFVFTTFPHWR